MNQEPDATRSYSPRRSRTSRGALDRTRAAHLEPVSAPPGSTVFVIDDDEDVRAAIADLLNAADLRSETFDTAEAFLRRGPASYPACIVLDLRLPGMDGLAVQRALSEAGITTPIIFVTGRGDVATTVQAMKSGAVEFLTKPFDDQALLDAVCFALRRDQATREQQRELSDLRARYARLTPRERQVMALVVVGRLNKQIAGELGTSEITVKIHRRRVMTKMQAQSVADLVRQAGVLERAAGAAERASGHHTKR